MKKIFITGGHFAPAKAVIQELLHRGGWEIYYLGRKYSTEGSNTLAFEFNEIQTLPVHYLTITTGRIQRQFFVNIGQSLLALSKVIIGLVQAPYWLIKYRPSIILSFGGYVAVPVVFWAWLADIPILTHEQTVVFGRANKLISFLADKIFVSWPESLSHFPKDKVLLTGNPIREEVKKLSNFKSQTSNLVYITGGSQGAKVLDEVVPKIAKKYRVISGRLTGEESAQALAEAKLIVSRAGANTISEILYLGKPAIVIPLPNTFGHEQEKNAQLIANIGLGEILDQKNLTAKTLLTLIDKVFTNYQKYTGNADRARALINRSAASLIVDQLDKSI